MSERQYLKNLYSGAIINNKGKSIKNTYFNGKMKWTTMNQINKLKSHINDLNNQKKEKENKIINYIKENNLESQTFELPNFNYKLSYKNQKVSESYSIKYYFFKSNDAKKYRFKSKE